MIKLTHYYRYFRQVLRLSHSSAVHFRGDYFLRIIRSFLEVAVTYIVIFSMYNFTQDLSGWTYPETLLLFALVQIIFSSVMMWFGSIQFIFQDIRSGKLDRLLLMPMPSLFLSSTKFCYITNIFRLLMGIWILFIALSKLSLTLTIGTLILTLISLFSACIICYTLFALASIVAFWSYSGDLWFFMDTLNSSMRYPIDVISYGFRWLFYVIPFVFIATVPAKTLLGKDVTLALISPLIAFIAIIILRYVWHRGLSQYEGASY